MICDDGICCNVPCDGPSQSCRPDGECREVAPAPALSPPGLLVGMMLLLAVAALALRRLDVDRRR